MARTGGGRTAAVAGAGLLAAVLALSGCSETAGGSRSSNAAAAPAMAPQQAAGSAGSTAGIGGGGAGGSSAGTVAVPSTGRSLIYTGEVQLRAPGVDAAVAAAERLTTAAGGYVDAEQTGPVGELQLTTYQPDGGTADTGSSPAQQPQQSLPEPGGVGADAAQLVLRIPAAAYPGVFQQLLGLGTVLGQERSTQDVTSQVVDVASRVRSQQASVDRVRALMDRAQDIGDVVSLEAALTQRESALESLEAEQQSLESQTALSTVTVQVFERPAAAAAAPAHRAKGLGSALLGALADGWHGLYLTFRALLEALSAVLPFALVLLPLGWLLLRLTRRRRTRPAAAVAAVPVPGPSDE